MKELDKLIDQIDAGMLGTDEAVKQVNQYFQEMNGGEEKNVSEETLIRYAAEDVEKPLEVSNGEIFKHVKNYLIQDIGEMLSLSASDIDTSANFLDIGLSSSQLIQMTEKMEEDFSITLYPTLLFEYQNIESLSGYLSEEFREKMISSFQIQSALVPEQRVKPEPKKANIPIETRLDRNMEQITLKDSFHDVAVVGISGIFPGSPDLGKFWDYVSAQTDLITEVPKERWDYKKVKEESGEEVRWGGFIQDIDKFDPAFFGISPREAELMDPQQRLLLQTIWNAVEDAGYKMSALKGTNTGLYIGAATNDYAELMVESDAQVEAFTSIGTTHSIVANRISYLFDFHGPSMSIDTACSSSLVALYEAVHAIRSGKCPAALVGGVNALLSPKLFVSFSKAGMLSKGGRCKTFDQSADGYVRGEGVGAVMLKPLSKAKEDGDHIYAVIKGCAVNHGGHANSLTAPNPVAQSELIQSAINDAGIDANTVSYIEAHGTGTSLGDPIEIEGLKKAYHALTATDSRVRKPECGIGSVKTNIGHLEAAAGIAGLIKTILSMEHKTLPGILHYHTMNPYIDLSGTPFYVVNKTKIWNRLVDIDNQEIPRRAGLSSFGFGGANAHIILEEYEQADSENGIPGSNTQIIPFSAKSEEQLRQCVKRVYEFLDMALEETDEINETDNSEMLSALSLMVSGIIGVPAEEIDAEEEFKELGFTTKEYEDLALLVNEKYEKKVAADKVSFASSLRGLLELLAEKRLEPAKKNKRDVNVSLENIAYTMQTGREEMNERLAVTAGSIEELMKNLKAYLNGTIKNVYYNNTKANNMADVLMSGVTGKQYLNLLMENKEYDKIAQLWVCGGTIEWDRFHTGFKRIRLSLPVYPFQKKSFWFPSSKKKDTIKYKVNGLHPLLGQNISTLIQQKFMTAFTGEEFFLAHHVVEEKKVLPGAAYVEMARVAAELSGEKLAGSIYDVVWIHPFSMEEKARNVYLTLTPKGEETLFQVRGKDASNVYAQGMVSYEKTKPSKNLDVNAVRRKCTNYKSKEQCYTQFKQMGLTYKPAFQTIQKLYYGNGEALAKISLNHEFSSEEMLLHPCVLDGAFQSALGCIEEYNGHKTYLPYRMKQIQIYKKLPEECLVHAVLTEQKTESYTISIFIYDLQGCPAAEITGFCMHTAYFGKMSFQENTGRFLKCEPFWKEKEGKSGEYKKT